MVKYLSEAWRAEVEKRLKAQLTPEKMNNLTSSMNNLYFNCPDGKNRYFFVGFADGRRGQRARSARAKARRRSL